MKACRVSVFASLVLTTTVFGVLGEVPAASGQELVPVPTPKTGRPLVNLRAPQAISPRYTGPAAAVKALGPGATPTALAVGDFDADGAPDVVAGYRTAQGGVISLVRGNPDAFAPKDPKFFSAAMQGKMATTLMSTASVQAVPESPDFLATADFNRDGYRDLLVGTRSGGLVLLAGDGKGNLKDPQAVPLPGVMHAMDVLADGHVAVSVDTPSGPEIVILAPGAKGLTAIAAFPAPAAATSVAWGMLGSGADLAVGAGESVMLVYGVLGAHPQTETVALGFNVAALVVGDFIWDRDGRQEIAVLGSDGKVRILQHGTLDTRPMTAADVATRRASLLSGAGQVPAMALGPWTVAKTLAYAGPVGSATAGFSSPRLAASKTRDLMVLDAGQNRLDIVDTSGQSENATAAMTFSGAPLAAVALRQKINAGRDLVVLTAGSTAMTVTEDAPDPTFNVTTTADVDEVNACATTSTVLSGSGPAGLSLREAVCEANNNGAATSVINLPAGTYQLSMSTNGGNGSGATASGELQVGMQSGNNITIVGASEGTTIIQQTNGVDRVIEQDEVLSGDSPIAIENLTVQNGTCGTGLDCAVGGGGILGLGISGDDLTLTDVTVQDNNSGGTNFGTSTSANIGGGVAASGSGNLVISGSTFSNNTAPASAGGVALGGGLFFGANASAGNMTMTNSVLTSNTAGQAGGTALQPGTGDSVSISGSSFTGNDSTASAGGGIAIAEPNGGGGTVSIGDSRIVGNTASTGGTGLNEASIPTTATNNWWGCNAGPGATGCDSISTSDSGTTFDPWLVLSISAQSTQIAPNTSTRLTADLTFNSDGTGGFAAPNGTPVSWGATLGTISDAGTSLTSGQAIATYNAGSSMGSGSGSTTVDNQTVSVTIDIIDTPPSITSANNTTLVVGSFGAFTVTTTGTPTPSIGEAGATLPSGVTFIDNHNGTATLSGTAGAGTTGTYAITITAQNGILPNASQSFTLTVAQTPTITWSPATTIINGTNLTNELNASASCGTGCGTFTYTATPTGEAVTGSTILAAGSYTLTATFNPGSSLYTTNSATSPLTVSAESVWIVDGAGGTSELAGNGAAITSSPYTGANLVVAIDSTGNAWSAGTGSSLLVETSQIGTHADTISSGTGGLDAPAGIAIDGSSQVWVTNGNNSVSLFTNVGAAVSPSTGFTDSSLSTPSGIAIDLGGSVWIANKGNNSVTRILGAAAPVAPLATGEKNNTTGAKP